MLHKPIYFNNMTHFITFKIKILKIYYIYPKQQPFSGSGFLWSCKLFFIDVLKMGRGSCVGIYDIGRTNDWPRIMMLKEAMPEDKK